MRSKTLENLKGHLRPGVLYRRRDLAPWSKSVDRHLKALTEEGVLEKLAPGLYYKPKMSKFGKLHPSSGYLVQRFLLDRDFLLFDPSVYNSLGLGTTQLWNVYWVYNRKRHGHFKLGNLNFDFRVKPNYPRTLYPEFLYVDVVNNLENLPEDRERVLNLLPSRLEGCDPKKLRSALSRFGTRSTKRYFESLGYGQDALSA